jgi:hypothetical protein
MGVIGSLAFAQLRHRPGRWGLLALGVALTIAVPLVSSGVARSVAAQTVRRTVSQLDIADRSLLVTQEPHSVYRRGTAAEDDQRVRTQLAQLTSRPVRRQLVYRELTLAGSSFFLAGADDLSTAVRVVEGRMPRNCTPTRCEVVLIGAAQQAALASAVSSLGVVIVGRAERTDAELVSGHFDTGGLPLLVGNGADVVSSLASLDLFGRTLAWAAQLEVERVVRLGVAAYVQRGADVDDELSATVGGTTFYRPDEALQEQDRRAALSARRFGLLGGAAAVLLLGFAVVAAVGLRREHGLLVAVLRRRGATTRQIGLLTALQTVVTCLGGALLGVAAGAAVAAVSADQAGLPVTVTVGHAVAGAALAAGLLAAAAAGLAAAVLVWPDAQARTVWQLLDLLAVCCLGAVLLAADRGSTDLSGGGGDPLVIALPVLGAVTAGLVAARLWGPLARLAERTLPRRSVAGRIALLGSIRRPLRALATTAFLTAAVASVIFAGAYRSTLLDGSADQAAFAVPLDVTVASSPEVTSVASSVDVNALRTALPGASVYATVRTGGSLLSPTGIATTLSVIGVDPDAVARMHRWSRTTGSADPAPAVADRLRTPPARPAPTVPAGPANVELRASGLSANLTLTLWLRDDSGRELAIPLVQRGDRVDGALPPLDAGPLHAVAIVVQEEADYATHRQHALGEGNTDQPVLAGTLTFGTVSTGGAPVSWDWTGWGSANGSVRANASSIALDYRLEGTAVVATPGFVADPALGALPVAVDPATAGKAHDGQLQITVAGQPVTARLVATLPRFPTVDGPFILVDRAALVARLDRVSPGSGAPSELWIAGDPATLDRTLRQAPYDRLTVTRRDAVQADLDADPVGRGSRTLLAIVGALALAVGAASLVLLVVGERRDGAGELHAWESDGVRPGTLRRMLFIRTLAVVGVALPIGVLAGYLMARIGARLVAVDASGSTPRPPLQTTIGSGWTVLVLVVGLGAGVLAVWTVAMRALREPLPVRPEVDLR